jgi:hypothetical protein
MWTTFHWTNFLYHFLPFAALRSSDLFFEVFYNTPYLRKKNERKETELSINIQLLICVNIKNIYLNLCLLNAKLNNPKTREYSRFSLDKVVRSNYWMKIIRIHWIHISPINHYIYWVFKTIIQLRSFSKTVQSVGLRSAK